MGARSVACQTLNPSGAEARMLKTKYVNARYVARPSAATCMHDVNVRSKRIIVSFRNHYNDVIMGAMTSQITSLTSVYSTVYLVADQRKYQSSASLAFMRKFTGDREFPAQMASKAENVSIGWRHHVSGTKCPTFYSDLSKFDWRLCLVIFKLVSITGGRDISWEISLRQMSRNRTYNRSTLVQAMA